ncbi:ATP-binding protein [Gordonibacter massiliensis (ex Traore et al. 2017)]|uniref:ATP-binding protein n=2 Tax=Gordonibacter massiliensis (ex Traore et al. 2017) TaxID=1841863 RepID=UPI001C8CBAE0|nr:ATP-binding protein [Gordonibacter massiliensis (ex Traore et al. 2017)]MBX9032784.1 HAMP domain-containing protein [Gordonibacter massiliensis (ex Traore et al. 2017)]
MANSITGAVRNAPLQVKMFGLIAAVVVAVAACSFAWMQSALSTSLSLQVESRARALATYVASRSVDPLLTNNIYALNALVDDTVKNNEDVKYLFVVGENGEVIVSSEKTLAISDELLAANASVEEGGSQRESSKALDTDAGKIMDNAAPVFKEGGAEVRVGMGYESVGSFTADVRSQLLVIVGLVLAVAMVVAYAIVKMTLKPVKDLVSLTERVSKGELGERAHEYNHDEIGKLAESFNRMLDDLQVSEAERNDYVDKLADKERTLGLLLQKVINAQEDERKRIARELHDETSHSLTAMLIELQSLRGEGLPTAAQERHAAALKALIDQALKDINQLAWNLRPSVLDKFGLQVSLERYVEEIEGHHEFSVDLVVRGDVASLPPDVEITIYRLVQEAVTNVVKYAQAREVGIMLVVNAAFVSVVVEDDGVGFDVEAVTRLRPGEHLGLLGMDERVSILGGTLDIESSPGGGTTIIAKVPLRKEAGHGV